VAAGATGRLLAALKCCCVDDALEATSIDAGSRQFYHSA